MGDEQGYDDQFNDGLFRTTLHSSKRQRPTMWPKSVSEMGNHTDYREQKTTDGYGDGDWHSNYMIRRGPGIDAAPDRPAFWKDSGFPREGSRPGRDNGGAWMHQQYGPPVWISSGTHGRY